MVGYITLEVHQDVIVVTWDVNVSLTVIGPDNQVKNSLIIEYAPLELSNLHRIASLNS